MGAGTPPVSVSRGRQAGAGAGQPEPLGCVRPDRTEGQDRPGGGQRAQLDRDKRLRDQEPDTEGTQGGNREIGGGPMIFQHDCPPRSVWQQFVNDGFVDSSRGELSSHLDGCTDCQATVERLMGRELAYVAISAELRQELPPPSAVCQRMLAKLQEQEPTGPIASGESVPDDPLGKRVYCPHCLELVHMQEAVGCEPMRCPLCWRAVGVDEEAPADYEVNSREDNRPVAAEVRDYVQSVEARARLELKRKP